MDQDAVLEPVEVLERSLEDSPIKRRPTWFKQTLQDAKRLVAPSGTFRESKRPQIFAGYVALVSNINDVEPSLFDEVTSCRFGEMPCWMNTSPS